MKKAYIFPILWNFLIINSGKPEIAIMIFLFVIRTNIYNFSINHVESQQKSTLIISIHYHGWAFFLKNIIYSLLNSFHQFKIKYSKTKGLIMRYWFVLILLAFCFHYGEKLLRIFNFRRQLILHKNTIKFLKLTAITWISSFFGFFLPSASGPDLIRIFNLLE